MRVEVEKKNHDEIVDDYDADIDGERGREWENVTVHMVWNYIYIVEQNERANKSKSKSKWKQQQGKKRWICGDDVFFLLLE